MKWFIFSALVFFGCSKQAQVPPPSDPAPVVDSDPTPPPTPEPKVEASTCNGLYETTDPEIAKQTFAFFPKGLCKFTHEGFPKVPYICSYEIKDETTIKVDLRVKNTTEGWKFENSFSEDCSEASPAGFGIKFRLKPKAP